MLNKKTILIKAITVSFAIIGILFYSNCTYDKLQIVGSETTGYPPAIANIMIPKCATAGCHNTQSKAGASGIDLTTWDNLFKGGNNNSCVIPYRSDQSYLMYFINTYSDLGPSLVPNMPYNSSPLSHDEVATIKTWIDNGAPNSSGFVKWSDNPGRQKIYVVNQGCNLVSVFDKATNLIMRVVNVGDPGNSTNRSPHEIKVSPDNKYWYTIFAVGGTRIEKYDCNTDKLVANIPVGNYPYGGSFGSSSISNDSKTVYAIDWAYYGGLSIIDFDADTLINMWYSTSGNFFQPHGSSLNNAGNILYVTGIQGNFDFKINISHPKNIPPNSFNYQNALSLDGKIPNTSDNLNPYTVQFTPDSSKYFVTCSGSNEVRIFNASNDAIIDSIQVGSYPCEMAMSNAMPYLFVSCMNDSITFPHVYGSVYVINYLTNAVVYNIYTGWQPHGIAVDDATLKCYVINRNFSANGPAPHHATSAGCGRDGYMTIIDMTTRQLVPGFNTELNAEIGRAHV